MYLRAGLAGAVAVWLALGGPSAAQDAPEFPSSLERDPLLLWLQRQTDIPPDRVLAVTPQALTAVVSVLPAGADAGPRVVIRAEALNAQSYERAGALSWSMSVSADCAGRRVKLGETTGFAARNLLGGRRTLQAGEDSWRIPGAGTALENVWRAACDPAFHGPFGTGPLRIAAADSIEAAPDSPAPAPAAAAPAAGGPVVQVGAVASDAEARGLLKRLAPQIGARAHWVETATVKGRVWRRALVGGFADAADATQFCARVKAAGGACFVRPGSPG
ncbi:MAG: hypothetical protein GC203_13535 [Phenylobacterium sp.]|uniref:SPOR domain-containing protein n=1 Tax=Phenylobacterium sp. TaxID=1871053 RepID=UPI002600405A|nr:SPOR domain-containing protein [Phenylobacterium sp.]MBI1198878.1 hypothetical protein [Phenylobacterium sp.]